VSLFVTKNVSQIATPRRSIHGVIPRAYANTHTFALGGFFFALRGEKEPTINAIGLTQATHFLSSVCRFFAPPGEKIDRQKKKSTMLPQAKAL
jgi:hypothetical protein